MTQVTVQQAQTHLKELLAAARRGEEVVIDDEHHPSVRLVLVDPAPSTGAPQFGSAKGKIEIAADFDAPLDDFREYVQ